MSKVNYYKNWGTPLSYAHTVPNLQLIIVHNQNWLIAPTN